MIDQEEAVGRCRNCIYCNQVNEPTGMMYLGCQVCANKWIVEVDKCPITQGRSNDKEHRE